MQLTPISKPQFTGHGTITPHKHLGLVIGLILIWAALSLFRTTQSAVAQPTILNGRIAFASNQDGDYEIYSMNADGSNILQLTNNDIDDRDPNWSPDGSQIVFVSSSRSTRGLRIMNADGSNQRTLSPSGIDAFDPDWSFDGSRIAFILFQSRAFNIFTVHPDGSNLTQITFGTGKVVGGNFYEPTWSPDGQHLAYLMGEVGGSARGSLDSFGLYSIDLNTLTSVVLPVNPSYNNVDWSPDGQSIIFEGITLMEVVQAVDADGTNYRNISDSFLSQTNPSWSPDGQQIVFQIQGRDIGIMDADGQNVVNLTNSPDVREIDPHWQPVLLEPASILEPTSDDLPAELLNGQIAFASNRDGDFEIYVMYADGSNVQQLTNNDSDDMWPAWSPDGSQIVFTSQNAGYSEIYVMNADGSNQVNLSQGETGYAPAWSPLGDKIAFTSDRGTAVDDIYVMNADGSNPVNLTRNLDSLDQLPAWTPDGRQIIFRTTREWEPLNRTEPYYDAYIMNADGSNQHKLMSAGFELSAVSMSPDGSRIVFGIDRDGPRIYVAEADGSNSTILPPIGDVFGLNPRWSPEGNQIVFSVLTGRAAEIAVMNSDGSNLRYLTGGSKSNIHPTWQPVIDTKSSTSSSDASFGANEVVGNHTERVVYTRTSGTDTEFVLLTHQSVITSIPSAYCSGLSPDLRFVAAVNRSEPATVFIYDLDMGSLFMQVELDEPGEAPCDFFWLDEQNIALVQSRSTQQIYQLDLATGTVSAPFRYSLDDFLPNISPEFSVDPLRSPTAPQYVYIQCDDIRKQGEVAFCGGNNRTILFDANKNQVLTQLSQATVIPVHPVDTRNYFAWSHSGDLLAYAATQRLIEVYDLVHTRYLDMRFLDTLPEPLLIDSVGALQWSPDNHKIGIWAETFDATTRSFLYRFLSINVTSQDVIIIPLDEAIARAQYGTWTWAPIGDSILVATEGGDLLEITLSGEQTLIDEGVSWVYAWYPSEFASPPTP